MSEKMEIKVGERMRLEGMSAKYSVRKDGNKSGRKNETRRHE